VTDLAASDDLAAPSIADDVDRPLDPRSVVLQRKVAWMVAGVVSIVGLAGVSAVGAAALAGAVELVDLVGAGLSWVGVAAGLGWRAHAWPPLAYRHAAYRVDARGIEIRRGVLWRQSLVVPRSRVQHTDVSQGPLERAHGLGTLVIYTAGTDHARVELAGLDHATALRIRDHLLPDEGGDAV
jgi:uncharacterized protein